jgi:cell division GTPase FtsZ
MIIFGAVIDEAMQGKVRVTVIATGFDNMHLGKGFLKAIPSADTLDIPTIIRQRQQARQKKAVNPSQPEDEQSASDLDTPTFLRKRMD